MFAEHTRGGAERDKGMLETELVEKSYRALVEKSERVSAEAGECEWRRRRV